MATNPQVPQGSLNRVRGSVTVPLVPELNVSASYVGTEGISASPVGKSTLYIPTLVGAVRSPQPYMMAEITVHLLRTQNLSNLYKTQMELDCFIGDITVRPDTSVLAPYQYVNCSISSVESIKINGSDAGFVIGIEGYYLVNSSLFDQAPSA